MDNQEKQIIYQDRITKGTRSIMIIYFIIIIFCTIAVASLLAFVIIESQRNKT